MILGKFFKDRRLWLITIAVFILVITVFDKNNLIEAWRLKQKINELEAQKDYYQNKITEDSTILENLKDDRFLEQYAREHYLMKREDETIYLLKCRSTDDDRNMDRKIRDRPACAGRRHGYGCSFRNLLCADGPEREL